jgi:hypothetical protein
MILRTLSALIAALAMTIAAALYPTGKGASRLPSQQSSGASPQQAFSPSASSAQAVPAVSPQAAEQQAKQQPLPAPAIRATTRPIQVSVLVHDKHGNPVTGLTKDDFTILDEKQQQTIQIFSAETNQPSAQPTALPPDTYTNRIREQGSVAGNITIILLDGLNTEGTDQTYARKQVIKFLSQIQPQDRVGLYTLDLNLTVLHDFTTDSTAPLEAPKNYQGKISPELTASTLHELPLNPPVPPASHPIFSIRS